VEWNSGPVRRWFVNLPPQLQYSEVRFRHGDDAEWAAPAFNDDDWKVTGVWDLPARAGIVWVRFRVRMGPDAKEPVPAGIMVATVRAYEIYWDGMKLGSSGVPAESLEAEVAGNVDELFSLPSGMHGPGEHVVAIRSSSFRCGFPAPKSGFRFLVDSPMVLQQKALREAFVPTLASGALFMTGLASLIMWLLAVRRLTLLLLCGVCLAGATMQAIQAFRWFYHYPADWHFPALTAMTVLMQAQALMTVAVVAVHFEMPRRRWLLVALVPAFATIAWLSPQRYNVAGVWVLATGLGVSFFCAAWAAWRKRLGAWPVVIGVAASAILLSLETDDYRANFFLKFLPVLLGLISALALQTHDERRKARAAALAAARLETELLRKSLQPHFLLNTLAALTEIVEQDPQSAVKLINDMSDEFRSLSRISAEKLIPLSQELELCRAHLRVMNVRLRRTWHLETVGADESRMVPPALFLTLIENGLVYQRAHGDTIFRLAEQSDGDEVRYTFTSPGETKVAAGRKAGGTGLRYVKARLEESFPGQWALEQGAVEGGWETVIRWKPDSREGGRS